MILERESHQRILPEAKPSGRGASGRYERSTVPGVSGQRGQIGGLGVVVLVFALLVFAAMAALALAISFRPWPPVTERFGQWSEKMHRRPWLRFWIPMAVFAWALIEAIWKAATDSLLYLSLALYAGVALVIQLRLWFWPRRAQ